jgi:hypothetical protein
LLPLNGYLDIGGVSTIPVQRRNVSEVPLDTLNFLKLFSFKISKKGKLAWSHFNICSIWPKDL